MKNFERGNAFYDERDVVDDDEKRERERERECVCVVVVVSKSSSSSSVGFGVSCVYFLVVFRVNTLFSFDDESAFDEGNKERRRRPR